MKRFLAICMVFCMIFSCVGVLGVAAEDETVTVEITSLSDNAAYVSDEPIVLKAKTNATNWKRINFYVNGDKLPGTVTASSDGFLVWEAPAAGSYQVVAKVITEVDAVAESAAKSITVSASETDATKTLSMTTNVPDGATNVCNELSAFRIRFNSALNANQSEKVTVTKGESSTEGLTVTQGIDWLEVSFDGTNALELNTSYTVSISDVEAASGNKFADTSWTFTTISDTCEDVKPIVTVTAPAAIGTKTRITAHVLFGDEVTKVEMYNGETALGEATKGEDGEYYLDVDLTAGEYNITAKASYGTDSVAESAAKAVAVTDADACTLKGIAEGDRFPIDAAAENIAEVYVVVSGETTTSVKPNQFKKAYFYVDDELVGETSDNHCSIPLTAGEHTLTVLTQNANGAVVTTGTCSYTALYMKNTAASVSRDFEEGTAGAEIPKQPDGYSYSIVSAQGQNDTAETATYAASPTGSGMVACLSGTSGNATILSFGGSGWGGISVPSGKIFTVEADMYAVSNCNNVFFRTSDQQDSYRIDLATLKSDSTAKKQWIHVSAIYDFEKLTYRGFVDGFEVLRGTLNSEQKDLMFKIYSNRYGTDAYYFDNISVAAKESVAVADEITYTVKGIADNEKIPVDAEAESLKRRISVVNADADGYSVSAASNLAKAEFYIDDVKQATVTTNPCQWDMPLNDFKSHTLKVVTTDTMGRTQSFNSSYRAFAAENDAASFTENFEGTANTTVTKENLNESAKAETFSSSHAVVYDAAPLRTGTAMKITSSGSSSGVATTLETNQSIPVSENSVVTVELDVYCESGSQYNKFNFDMRNSNGWNMKNDTKTILSGFATSQLSAKQWHRFRWEFDVSSLKYRAFLDGYEFERGDMKESVKGREVYFQFGYNTWAQDTVYIDRLYVCTKTEGENQIFAQTVSDGNGRTSVVLNNTDSSANFLVFYATYASDGSLASVEAKPVSLLAKETWQESKTFRTEENQRFVVYLWDTDLKPLTVVR